MILMPRCPASIVRPVVSMAAILILGRLPSAEAQLARAYAAAGGSDGNSCASVNAPCRTLAGATAKAAAGGEVVVLDTGQYGGLTITKSVRIHAPAGVVAIVSKSISIKAAVGDNVVLRGLTLKANPPLPDLGIGGPATTGTAIELISGGTLHVESSVIDGWDIGIHVTASTPSTCLAHVGNPSPECKVTIEDTTLRNCRVGLFSANDRTKITIDESRFDHNTNGIVAPAGRVAVRGSVLDGSVVMGIQTDQAAEVNIDKCLIANNDEGIVVGLGWGGGTVRLSNSMVTGNGIGVSNHGPGGHFESFGNNAIRGNLSDIVGIVTSVALQ